MTGRWCIRALDFGGEECARYDKIARWDDEKFGERLPDDDRVASGILELAGDIVGSLGSSLGFTSSCRLDDQVTGDHTRPLIRDRVILRPEGA